MKKIIRKFRKWVHFNLFPSVYTVNFRLPDDTIMCMLDITDDSLVFGFLKKPCHISECNGKTWKELGLHKPRVALTFHTEDSIDKFITHLHTLKEKFIANQAAKILAEGGTIEFVREPNEDDFKDLPFGAKIMHYTATFELPKSNPSQ